MPKHTRSLSVLAPSRSQARIDTGVEAGQHPGILNIPKVRQQQLLSYHHNSVTCDIALQIMRDFWLFVNIEL